MASELQRAQWRDYNRRRRAAAAQENICSTCLARPNARGKKQCRVCWEKRAQRAGA